MSKGKYGTRRISEHLKETGYDIGRYRARTLMKKAGVSVTYKRKFKHTTDVVEQKRTQRFVIVYLHKFTAKANVTKCLLHLYHFKPLG